MIFITIFIRKRMNKFYILLILVLNSCGLPYCHKVQLTDDDLQWINNFTNNDTIYYKSNKNSIDTVIINEKTICNPQNTFVLDTEGVNWLEGAHEFYGFADVEMTLLHNFSQYNIAFRINRISTNDTLRYSLWFGDKKYMGKKIKEAKYTANNIRYNDCILIDANRMCSSKTNPQKIDLKQIVWNKKKGLLRYTLQNDEIYTQDLGKTSP